MKVVRGHPRLPNRNADQETRQSGLHSDGSSCPRTAHCSIDSNMDRKWKRATVGHKYRLAQEESGGTRASDAGLCFPVIVSTTADRAQLRRLRRLVPARTASSRRSHTRTRAIRV